MGLLARPALLPSTLTRLVELKIEAPELLARRREYTALLLDVPLCARKHVL